MSLEHRRWVEELCRLALERDPVERSAFLTEACHGDEELRHEVDLLINSSAAEGRTQRWLVPEATAGMFNPIAGSAALGSPAISVPGQISHYRIVSKIGEGGMGVVYVAHDERLQRSVAIKMIRETTESPESKSRFWQEARSLARINHPRICQIFEVAEEAGIPFLVLELLEGCSLEERLKAGPLPLDETRKIAIEMLEALEALHNLNIIHRDLKPSNVFLTPHGVKLLDFGLARFSGTPLVNDVDSVSTATHLTAPRSIVGTPHYMAPEQVDGSRAGPAADLFAAACVIYEMIAGRRAFAGASAIDVLYSVKHSEPPRLSGSPAISAIYNVICRAIEKRPENRYQSAKEMIEAVRSADLVGSQEPQVRTTQVTRFIALPFRVLRPDNDTDFLAYSLPDAISSSLSGIDSLIVRSSLMAARFDASDAKRIGDEADVNVILTGTMLRVGDQLRVSSQLVEAPSGALIWSDTGQFALGDIFQLQDSLTKRIVQLLAGPLTDRERSTFQRDVPAGAKAYEYYLRANQIVQHRTTDNAKLACDLLLRCVQEDPSYAPAWARLGRAYRLLEKFGEESEENFERADGAYRRAFALNPDLSMAHNLYTYIETDLGLAPSAMVRLLERARLKRNDPELFAGLVQSCRYCGELRASLVAHQRATSLDPHSSTSIAHTYFLLGDFQKVLDEIPPERGFYLDAIALASSGREGEALSRLRERERLGAGGPRTMMRSLRALLEGDRAGAALAVGEHEASGMRDPESLFYVARHMARIDELGRAIEILFRVIDQNFVCDFSLAHDPWLSSLRSHPQYGDLLHRTAERRRGAHTAFVKAGGELLLRSDSLTSS
jgi:serine/threonine protein kinase/tetratricopeptide (TPR) repeat protein